MYTVVLMAALSSGSAAPDWHRHGGGCHGVYTGCNGCYGGYSHSGYGLPYGGSCVGTYGGYTVAGPNTAYGCWGFYGTNSSLTVFSGPGTYGACYGGAYNGFGVSFQCHGCYGCYGGWSCYGSPTTPAVNQLIAPVPPQGIPQGDLAPPPVNPTPAVPGVPMSQNIENRIRTKVVIEVPENAKLFVDGMLMKDGPTQRVFQTPPLSPNETYFYDVRVEVTTNGVVSSNSQRIVVRPGESVVADLRVPSNDGVVTASGTAPTK